MIWEITGGIGKRIRTEEGDFCLVCLSKVVRTLLPIDRMYPLRTLSGFKLCFLWTFHGQHYPNILSPRYVQHSTQQLSWRIDFRSCINFLMASIRPWPESSAIVPDPGSEWRQIGMLKVSRTREDHLGAKMVPIQDGGAVIGMHSAAAATVSYRLQQHCWSLARVIYKIIRQDHTDLSVWLHSLASSQITHCVH